MLEVAAAASAPETGMGTDTVTLGCPINSPRHPPVGLGEHPVPHSRPPSHSLDPCGMVRRTGLVYLSRADLQIPPRQHCSQDLCTLLSPVPFLILLSATLIPPFAYRSVFPNKQQSFFFPWVPVLLHLYPNKVLVIRLPTHWWPCRTMARKVPSTPQLSYL